MRAPPWARGLGAALLGAATMLVLGQLLALVGGSCTILCRPPIAGLSGAVLGLLLLGSAQRG